MSSSPQHSGPGRAAALVLVVGLSLTGCASGPDERAERWNAEERADVHVQLGWSYLQRNQLETAREELRLALEADPRNARAHHALALLQLRFEDPEAAKVSFRRAVRLDPEYLEAKNDYGSFLCGNGRTEQGLDLLESALDSPLNRAPALSALRAGACVVGSEPARARAYLERALAHNPKLPAALYYMATINFGEGNFMSARAFLERYFAVGPETPQSLLYAVRVERELGAVDLAEDYATRLRSRFPRSPEARDLGRVQP